MLEFEGLFPIYLLIFFGGLFCGWLLCALGSKIRNPVVGKASFTNVASTDELSYYDFYFSIPKENVGLLNKKKKITLKMEDVKEDKQ